MTERDAILAKISNIKNCLTSIKSSTDLDPKALDDQFKQDVFVLNLQRAVQAVIDMTNLVIANRGLELPRSYKHSFSVLARNKLVEAETAEKMGKMAGFRNIAVHNYTQLDPDILKSILQNNLRDFEEFYSQIFAHYKNPD